MALDWFKQIFGGGEQTQTNTTTPGDYNDPAFKALREPLAGALGGLLNTGGANYTGPMNAPIGQNEQTTLGQLQGMTGPGTNRTGLLNKTIAGDFLPGQGDSNPFLRASIEAAQRPTQQALEETLGRTLPGRFTMAGQNTGPQGSSAFDRAAAIATRGAAQAMGDIATNISSNAYTTERNNQNQAIQLSQNEVQQSVQNLQAQALPRMIQELGIERGLQLFQQKTANLLDILKTMAGVSAPVIATAGKGEATGENTPGVLADIAKFVQPIKVGGK